MVEKHIKKVSEIFQRTNNIALFNKYFEENLLGVSDRILIVKEVLSINTHEAYEIVVKKYRGEISDELLDLFLNSD